MTKLTEAAGRVIAGEMVSVFSAADLALAAGARTTTTMLEGTERSDMHPRTKQKLLETLLSGQEQMLAGRRAMVDAHAQMIVIQRTSNIAETDFGCWGGPSVQGDEGNFFTTGKAAASHTKQTVG